MTKFDVVIGFILLSIALLVVMIGSCMFKTFAHLNKNYSTGECFSIPGAYYKIIEVRQYGVLVEMQYDESRTINYYTFKDLANAQQVDCSPLTQTE